MAPNEAQKPLDQFPRQVERPKGRGGDEKAKSWLESFSLSLGPYHLSLGNLQSAWELTKSKVAQFEV